MPLSSDLARLILAVGVALLGGALSAVAARTHKQLCAFISLGAGSLLGVAAFGIAPECLAALRWWQFLLGVASGYLLFAIISRYLFHVCPACAASHFDDATTHRLAEFAVAMMIALGIHCAADGIALAAGRAESAPADLSITLAICVHKFPEGLALGSLLLGGGFSRGKMLGLVGGVESATFFGGVLGWFIFGNVSETWLALALANAGGGFLFLGIHAVAGEILSHHKRLVLSNLAAGFLLISALVLYFHLHD